MSRVCCTALLKAWTHILEMSSMIDPRSEGPALRRVSLLLQRLRQDGVAPASELSVVEAGIHAIRHAAVSGRLIVRDDLARIEGSLRRVDAHQPVRGRVAHLLCMNALDETRELLSRLSASESLI